MKTKVRVRAIWPYVLALVAGLGLGSLGSLRLGQQHREAVITESPTVVAPLVVPGLGPSPRGESASLRSQSQEFAAPDHELHTATIIATADLRLRPMYRNQVFLGYEVAQSTSDPRFKVGDIIIGINGKPVENSAAGGELLIIALNDADALIDVQAD